LLKLWIRIDKKVQPVIEKKLQASMGIFYIIS